MVRAHLENDIVINGRFGTRFRSAFIVRGPIAREEIVDVRRGDVSLIMEAEVDLDSVT